MAAILLLPFSAAVSRRGVLGGAAASSLAAQHATPAAHTTRSYAHTFHVIAHGDNTQEGTLEHQHPFAGAVPYIYRPLPALVPSYPVPSATRFTVTAPTLGTHDGPNPNPNLSFLPWRHMRG